ncbi:MAG TPA: hypothetical protein VN831_10900 [Bradyrhizobium sp.]|nr:hypothetical protein [Bradyrhizobium sp.]
MFVSAKLAARIIAASLAAISLPARADDRTLLDACQALVDRASQSAQDAGAANNRQDDAEFRRCQQIIREWALRDARMTVDEHGRPLR